MDDGDLALLELGHKLTGDMDGLAAMAREVRSTPPVHPNCRCVIGPDGVWYDAEDAKVCVYCMTLGAAWNLKLDEPPDEQEIADLLDRDGREAFRKAIERDSTVADAIIGDAQRKATGGIIIEVGPSAEPMTVTIERLATQRLAELRARARIRVDRVPESLRPMLPDAADFAPGAGPKVPRIVQVVIAETEHARVVRHARRAKIGDKWVIQQSYYVQTAGGRSVARDDTLGLALLILLALEERERRKREQREAR